MSWRATAVSDRGRVRADNEDAFVIDEGSGLFAVFDGFGGDVVAKDASARGAHAFHGFVVASRQGAVAKTPFPLDPRLGAEANRFSMAMRVANQRIFEAHGASPGTVGATAVALGLTTSEMCIVHAGDARAYRMRGSRLELLTTDHTRAAKMIAEGTLRPEEARFRPDQKGLTLALGLGPDVIPAVLVDKPLPGDRYLLCSDGLTDLVSDPRILAIMQTLHGPGDRTRLERAALVLVEAANVAGGDDNITALVVEVN